MHLATFNHSTHDLYTLCAPRTRSKRGLEDYEEKNCVRVPDTTTTTTNDTIGLGAAETGYLINRFLTCFHVLFEDINLFTQCIISHLGSVLQVVSLWTYVHHMWFPYSENFSSNR